MTRLDAEIVNRKIAQSRERAKVLIKNGSISVNGKVCLKPSFAVESTDEIVSSESDLQYVGRGGLKLEKALDEFEIELDGKVCLDIGASTGGFTDCMLQRGAVKVFAVDVGHGQLAESLKNDHRVVNLEGTDIRNVNLAEFGSLLDFISIDVSFISLKQILPKAFELLSPNGIVSVLIKPQFEAGRSDIGKNGIVKDRKVHRRVLGEIDCFSRNLGLYPLKYTFSPVTGGSGNIEYLAMLSKTDCQSICDFTELVENAWKTL